MSYNYYKLYNSFIYFILLQHLHHLNLKYAVSIFIILLLMESCYQTHMSGLYLLIRCPLFLVGLAILTVHLHPYQTRSYLFDISSSFLLDQFSCYDYIQMQNCVFLWRSVECMSLRFFYRSLIYLWSIDYVLWLQFSLFIYQPIQ